MVDLKKQYDLIKDEIDLAINDILESTCFINGPVVKGFEEDLQKYLKVKHVITCANGTDALQIGLMGLKLKPGDEIITSNFSFASTIEVILLLKLKPVLVDIDIQTFNINSKAIVKAITSKTKAIIPVHLFGQSADMESIFNLAKKYNISILEDNAQSLGADYTFKNGNKSKVGTIGDISTTSFYPAKNLGAFGDGGAIITNNDELAKYIRRIVNHGMYKKNYHDVLGVNSRLDALQASILKVKLKYLDVYNQKRKQAALYYNMALGNHPKIKIPFQIADGNSHIFHQYTIRILDGLRDGLTKYLTANKIPFGIFYPVPLHLQKAYVTNEIKNRNFPVTNMIVDQVISLPIHPDISEEQIEYISSKILDYLNNKI